jgi:hypothetical protein
MSVAEIWSFDFTGRKRTIKGRDIEIEQQLTEVLDDRMGQRQVLTLARYLDTNEPIMLKIRYEYVQANQSYIALLTTMSRLNPRLFGIEDVEENREVTETHYLHEIDTLETVEKIGHGPQFIDYATQEQGPEMPYPPGLVDFYMTTRVPGEKVGAIFDQLSHAQLASIRKQLAFILE